MKHFTLVLLMVGAVALTGLARQTWHGANRSGAKVSTVACVSNAPTSGVQAELQYVLKL